MATASRERIAKRLLQQGNPTAHSVGAASDVSLPSTTTFNRTRATISFGGGGGGVGGGAIGATAATGGGHRTLLTLDEEKLLQREQGWNDRFYQAPTKPRHERSHGSTSYQARNKEERIVEEKTQYGGGNAGRSASVVASGPERQRAAYYKIRTRRISGIHTRLEPISSPILLMMESKGSTKEEKLRFRVLKAIDARESLIYQLNAVIICTPVLEPIQTHREGTESKRKKPQDEPIKSGTSVVASSSTQGNAMTNAKEATKLMQQLATDLQLAGVQCVESLVEWMLEAGANDERPPIFQWRGINYFVRMMSDLDFVEEECHLRGIKVPCFSTANPLLIKPNQKLGRVWAAQSIISEMVDLANNIESSDEGSFGKYDKEASMRSLLGFLNGGASVPTTETPINEESLPLKQAVPSISNAAVVRSAGTSKPPSLAKVATPDAKPRVDASDQPVLPPKSSSSSKQKSRATIAVSGSGERSLVPGVTPQVNVEKSEQSSAETSNLSVQGTIATDSSSGQPNKEATAITGDATTTTTEDKLSGRKASELLRSRRSLPRRKTAADISEAYSINSNLNRIQLAQDFHHQLERFSYSKEKAATNLHPARASNVIVELSFLEWYKTQTLADQLEEGDTTVSQMLEGSLLFLFELYELTSSTKSLVALLSSELGERMHLVRCLVLETMAILDAIFEHVTDTFEDSFDKLRQGGSNGETSGVENDLNFSDILQTIGVVLKRITKRHGQTLWKFSEYSVSILRILYKEREKLAFDLEEDASLFPISEGLSRFIRICYPYLLALPRERLHEHVHNLDETLTTISIDLREARLVLDSTCKSLLLTADLCQEQEQSSTGCSFPKLEIVCDRNNVLTSSMQSLAPTLKGFTSPKTRTLYHLYPFFQSSFGEKTVHGVQVEEGEGKGPLKEWFQLISDEFVTRWTRVAQDQVTSIPKWQVNGNELWGRGIGTFLKPGFRVEWTKDDAGESFSGVVNTVMDQNMVRLDRIVSITSVRCIDTCNVTVLASAQAFLVFVKNTETYWLNEQTPESEEHRQVLFFFGWLVANAIIHHTKMNFVVNCFLFRRLFGPEKLELGDVVELDDDWYQSLLKMKKNSSDELKEILALEEVVLRDAKGNEVDQITFELYLDHVLEHRFGRKSPLHWQLQAIKEGFESVISTKDLTRGMVHYRDLFRLVCGDDETGDAARDQDFQLEKVFRVTIDPEFAQNVPYQRVFWNVINKMDGATKRKMVKFITGVDALPLPGTEFLRIEMPFSILTPQDYHKTLHLLPQAHTCDNTLELPNYWRAVCWSKQVDPSVANDKVESEVEEILYKKLLAAVEFSHGYGLDVTESLNSSGQGASNNAANGKSRLQGLLPSHNNNNNKEDAQHNDKEEQEETQFDSLDIPMLGDDIATIPSTNTSTDTNISTDTNARTDTNTSTSSNTATTTSTTGPALNSTSSSQENATKRLQPHPRRGPAEMATSGGGDWAQDDVEELKT